MLEKLKDSPIAWLILAALTILSVILAIYYGVKSKKVKRLSFINKNLFLMENPKGQFDNIKIFYENKEINDIVVSKFTIWNSGNTVINQSDMVETKELIITADDTTTILEAKVLYANEETNRFSVEILDKNHVLVNFNYIDKNEGCIVQIVYAGSHSCPKIDCKVKDGQPLQNLTDTMPYKRIFRKATFIKSTMMAMGIAGVLFAVLAVLQTISIFNYDLQKFLLIPPKTDETSLRIYTIIMAVILWIYVFLLFVTFLPKIRTIFKPRIPKALKEKSDFSNLY